MFLRDHSDRISNNPPTEMLLRSLVLTMKAQTRTREYADISDQVGGFSVQMTPSRTFETAFGYTI